MLVRRTALLPARAAARTGFTLMELLVVVAILVVLVGVATPMYLSYLESSKVRVARTDAVRLAGVLKNFQVMNGSLPQEGDWSMLPLERNPPLDPWNKPYQWISSEAPQADGSLIITPIVFSTGPNGNFGPDGECSSVPR